MNLTIPMGILLAKAEQFHPGFVDACLSRGTVVDGCLNITVADYDKAKQKGGKLNQKGESVNQKGDLGNQKGESVNQKANGCCGGKPK